MNIYVGNLPFDAQESDLRTLFAEFGAIDSAAVVNDRDTGRSRGFGFVEMASAEEALRAIEKLDGHELNGRRLNVNEARQRSNRR
jgi:RNA recognition motif-containing protein